MSIRDETCKIPGTVLPPGVQSADDGSDGQYHLKDALSRLVSSEFSFS